MGVLQETKLTDGIHANQGEGYYVWEIEDEIRHWVRISVVWRRDTVWQVEGIINFGPNMASFLLMSGSRRWHVLGAYVPPHDAPSVNCIEQAL